jgi:protein-S-isoprenylcysteine O-methyltransferase Ste14
MTTADNRALAFPVAPVAYAAAVAAAALLHVLWPVPWLGSPLGDILVAIGVLGLLAGGWLIVGAARALRAAGTTMRPDRRSEHLVTAGVFAFTRNPIYLGMAVIVGSAGLVLGIAWLVLAAFAGAMVVSRFAIRGEERHLAERFGKRYRDYQKLVRRWF